MNFQKNNPRIAHHETNSSPFLTVFGHFVGKVQRAKKKKVLKWLEWGSFLRKPPLRHFGGAETNIRRSKWRGRDQSEGTTMGKKRPM